MLVMIDNYDSFTYNIVQYLYDLDVDVNVFRNDETTVSALTDLRPDQIVISPGPGRPDEGGISLEAITHFAGRIPVLGVCLGHQSLAQAFGGQVVRHHTIMHGKTSKVRHDQQGLFKNVPDGFQATRYHSLVVDRASLPKTFTVTAWTDDDTIMGLRHDDTGAVGVQFHPESILSEHGHALLRNFVTS